MDNYVDASSVVNNCKLDDELRIYKFCDIKDSSIKKQVSIGDFSRISQSTIQEKCVIQRNNMIYSSCIGRLTYTGKNCTIWNSNVGGFCSISWNVSIGGANHDYRRVTTHAFLYSDDFKIKPKSEIGYNRFADSCEIGNDVWIAANACVCRGVRVGNGAVIGAGAVVTKDVAPYSIVAGVPAVQIKKRFNEEIIDILNKSQWWNLPFSVIRNEYSLFNSIVDESIAYKILELSDLYLSKE